MASKKAELRAKILSALASDDSQNLKPSFAEIREAQEKLARMGIGVAGKYSPAARGKNVLVEGVLSHTFFVPESFDQPHQVAWEIRGENGQTCVEVFDTRIQDGIEFLCVRRDSLGLQRAQSYLTDSRGIILPTAEAQLVRNNVSQKEVEKRSSEWRESISVDGFIDPETGAWVCPDDLEHEEDSAPKKTDHQFLDGSNKTIQHRRFEKLVEASKHFPREDVDGIALIRKECERAETKLHQKWKDLAEVAAGAVSKLANLREVEPVIPAEKQVPVRTMTFAEMIKSQKKRLANRPENPEVDQIARIRAKRAALKRQLNAVNLEIKDLRAAQADEQLVWDRTVGDWVSPLAAKIEKLERRYSDLSQQIRWENEDLNELTKV